MCQWPHVLLVLACQPFVSKKIKKVKTKENVAPKVSFAAFCWRPELIGSLSRRGKRLGVHTKGLILRRWHPQPMLTFQQTHSPSL